MHEFVENVLYCRTLHGNNEQLNHIKCTPKSLQHYDDKSTYSRYQGTRVWSNAKPYLCHPNDRYAAHVNLFVTEITKRLSYNANTLTCLINANSDNMQGSQRNIPRRISMFGFNGFKMTSLTLLTWLQDCSIINKENLPDVTSIYDNI